ncbi:ArdC family protein [Spirosoma oryzae]|nr:zincin-like metallopeptidase domain-containing protein [Spirosoma oryzae]
MIAPDSTAVATPTSARQSYYERMTARIVEQLRKGFVPWHRPWKFLLDGARDVPRNYVSKKAYKGFNAFVLEACLEEGQRPYFLTMKQANDLGGKIRKGSKGQLVTYYQFKADELSEEGEIESKRRYIERSSIVFNVFDVEGIDIVLPSLSPLPPTADSKKRAACEAILAGYVTAPPTVHHDPQRAYYQPALDVVNMPRLEAFNSTKAYYHTYFHEMVHSTGHPTRLNRAELVNWTGFGSINYSREELTAELGALYLMGVAGLSPEIDSSLLMGTASYIDGYLKRLQNDPDLFWQATRQAQKAVDYMLGSVELP